MMAAPSQVAHNASSSDKGGAQILKPSLSSRQCGKLQAKTIRYHFLSIDISIHIIHHLFSNDMSIVKNDFGAHISWLMY